MGEEVIPRLLDLCIAAIRDEFLQAEDDNNNNNNDILLAIYEFPSELFHRLLPHLPPLLLHKLHDNMPFDLRDDFERPANVNGSDYRKRRRCGILDAAWEALYKIRWPGNGQQNQVDAWLSKHDVANCDSVVDWRQTYWEAHLQDCVDAVAETALLPSYDGFIGEIQIPDTILEIIGCRDRKFTCGYLNFSYHCQQFGIYARYLRLPNALCVPETCHLLQSSNLESLELHWIKSNDHVVGLCKLLNQNSETLKSIDFIHCKLSPSHVNSICQSLHLKDLQVHGIEHFSIKRSSFMQTDSSPLPVGLASFLTSGRSLSSLTLCDDQIGRNFTRVIFNSLLDASASISALDLSENNISGFLSQFRWRSNSTLGIGRMLHSLRVLNLRNCNLVGEDVDCLRQALVHMPKLQKLDLSDNAIEDGIRSLIPYFTEISLRDSPFVDLKLENCELTCNHVRQLLEVLSTMKISLNVLSIKGNRLGSKIGAPLGKFICTGVCTLDVEDVGLGSSGFLEALEEISKETKIVCINISNNRGGMEAANFVARLISHAQEVVSIDARYNLMPMGSLSILSSALKASKAKLEHLDLAGNVFCDQLDDAAILSEFQTSGHFVVNLSSSDTPNAPHDDDP